MPKFGCGLILMLGVTAFVGTVDTLLGLQFKRQMRAASRPSVPGVITHSESHTRPGGKGPVHDIDLRYSYRVDGKPYEGHLYSYGVISDSGGRAARIVRENPVERAVDVFYDPADPADAILAPGLQAFDLFVALFLTPFNVVMLGMWAMPLVAARKRRAPAGGAMLQDDGLTLRVRMPATGPLAAAAMTILASTFILTFVVAFGFGGDPSLFVMEILWGLVGALALIAYMWRVLKIGGGGHDLVLDRASGTLSLPATYGRRERCSLPRSAVRGVELKILRPPQRNQWPLCQILLVINEPEGEPRRERLCEQSDRIQTTGLADFLQQEIVGKR